MKSPGQNRPSAVLAMLIVVFLGVAVVSQTKVEAIRAETRPQDALYVPSAKALKRLSLGYTGLMADVYWTRAIQYFGWKHKHREMDYQLLYPLLDITTQLDPQLIVAYRFGATFLAQQPPNGAGEPDKAIELIERGIRANPNEWRLYYELGFVQSMEKQDYVAAAQAFERGSKVPGAYPFMKVVAAAMAQHGGDRETARLLWQTTYDTTEDAMVKLNAERHLRALQVDEAVPRLETLVRAYREKTGNQPRNFVELVNAGLLRSIPLDPLGHPYKLMPDGRIEVQDPEALPFIKMGLPRGYKPGMVSVPSLKM
jgi:tetratricopeptide (TPR) repeat protein